MKENPTINFFTASDISQASSRLRAWYLAEELKNRGYDVSINSERRADVCIFQKVQKLDSLLRVKQTNALVVYDFDDNYFTADIGTRDNCIGFINLADIVTVGSAYLHTLAEQYHRHVFCLENPLDIASTATPKSAFNWSEEGRICWFGNAENIRALESLSLDLPVQTITKNGDIPWDINTIDQILPTFDLALIPVPIDEWNAAKNANRLLKCIALKLPFLASKTQEHERICKMLSLPDYFFVEGSSSSDWKAAVDTIKTKYSHIDRVLSEAREIALTKFGLQAIVDGWEGFILSAWRNNLLGSTVDSKSLSSASVNLNIDDDLEIILWGTNSPHAFQSSIQSLVQDLDIYASLKIVSAFPLHECRKLSPDSVAFVDEHKDFFAVFKSLEESSLPSSPNGYTVFLRAGAELTPGFLTEVRTRIKAGEQVICFRSELKNGRDFPGIIPPVELKDIVLQPVIPNLLVVSNSILIDDSFKLRSDFIHFTFFDLLLRVVASERFKVGLVSAPVVFSDNRVLNIIVDYVEWLRNIGSVDVATEIGDKVEEGIKLETDLLAHIVETHSSIFNRYLSTVVCKSYAQLLRQSREIGGLQEIERDYRNISDALMQEREQNRVLTKDLADLRALIKQSNGRKLKHLFYRNYL